MTDTAPVATSASAGTEQKSSAPPPVGRVLREMAPEAKSVIVFVSVGGNVTLDTHPGAHSMETQLVGTADLANGERVWLVAWEHPFEGRGRERFQQVRRTRVEDADGKQIGGNRDALVRHRR